MPISNAEAAEALSSIETAALRSKQLQRYRRASPYLLLWGSIWLLGFSADDLLPAQAHRIWQVLILIGLCGQVGLLLRSTRSNSNARHRGLQSLALSVIAAVFGFGVVYLMRVRDPQAMLAFSGLMAGTIYAGIGVFAGLRLLITGLGILALTFTGYAMLTTHYALWMALVCGGGLILAGLWLRRV